MTKHSKWKCKECAWHGALSALLKAPNPFDPTETVSGCPVCKAIDCFTAVCDEPRCKRDASCGWPSYAKGYRHTCSEHMTQGENAGDLAPNGWTP